MVRHPASVDEIFFESLQLASVAERAVFLSEACEGNSDHGNVPALPCSNLVYVFEWWMRRTIEEIDSRRFTELIEIREARSAKLLATVNCPPIRWRKPDEPILAGLMESRPHDSIVVVDTGRLAQALFGSQGRYIGHHPDSHAWALDERLSGKRVRVVHNTPGGIASIEALDCTLSQGEVGQLIRIANPLAWSCTGSKPHDYSAVRDGLIATLLESGGFRSKDLGGISISRTSAADGQTLRLLAEREVLIGCHFTPGIFYGSFAPSGTILCAPDGRVETAWVHARIHLPSLHPSRLFYEATFDLCDDLSFSYACRDPFNKNVRVLVGARAPSNLVQAIREGISSKSSQSEFAPGHSEHPWRPPDSPGSHPSAAPPSSVAVRITGRPPLAYNRALYRRLDRGQRWFAGHGNGVGLEHRVSGTGRVALHEAKARHTSEA